jgi:hypothetical protein
MPRLAGNNGIDAFDVHGERLRRPVQDVYPDDRIPELISHFRQWLDRDKLASKSDNVPTKLSRARANVQHN